MSWIMLAFLAAMFDALKAVLLSVLFGSLIFHEQHLKERLTGATVMIAGVFCITLL